MAHRLDRLSGTPTLSRRQTHRIFLEVSPFDEPIPPAAIDRWNKAQALRAIAFDASAELELKSAFFATGSPRLLFEAAQAAFDQGHFAAGMAYGRLIVPNF